MILFILKIVLTILLIILLKWQFITPYLTYRRYKRLGFSGGNFIPVLGYMWHMWISLKYRGDINAFFRDLALKNPTSKGAVLNLGSHVYIYLQDTSLIKDFLVNKFHFYKKEEFVLEFFRNLSGKLNIITAEGEQWKKSRKLLSKCFHFENLKANIPTMITVCEEVFSRFDEKNSRCDALNTFQEITGRVFIASFCGPALANLKVEDKSLPLVLAEMIAELSEGLFTIQYALLGKMAYKLGLIKGHTPLLARVNKVRKVVREHIEEKRKLWKEEKAKGVEKGKTDLLFELFEASESLGSDITSDRILDEIMVLFVAGTDTTGHLLAHTSWVLTQHPEVLAKLKAEIDERVTSKSDLTWEKLQTLPYLNAVFKECLRLYPGANEIFPREAVEPHQLGDISVKKGWLVALSLVPNFNNELYFKDSQAFRPERWLSEAENIENSNIFAYLPFSAGGRNCIGQNLAMLEGKIALIYFLKKFDFKLKEGYRMRWTAKFLTEPEEKLELLLARREGLGAWQS